MSPPRLERAFTAVGWVMAVAVMIFAATHRLGAWQRAEAVVAASVVATVLWWVIVSVARSRGGGAR